MKKRISTQIESLSWMTFAFLPLSTIQKRWLYIKELFLLRSKERTPILLSGGENFYHYTDWVKSKKKWKIYKILNDFWENLFNLNFIVQWYSKYISLRTNILRLCKIKCDLTNFHAVHVIMWRYLSKTLPVIRTVLKNLSLFFIVLKLLIKRSVQQN